MLTELTIKNFAVVKDLKIDFKKGMSVFTGETGAGKSIIIDAIAQLLGQRAQTDLIRYNENSALIEACFDISQNKLVLVKLEELGFEKEDNLIVSKTISLDGKSICRINYRQVTLNILKEIVPLIVDIHSQYENQYLLNSKIHLSLLDSYCNNEVLLNKYHIKYKEFVKLKKELDGLIDNDLNEAELEMYQFQFNEIEKANIKENEYEELEEEFNYINQFEKIGKVLETSYDLLNGDGGTLETLYSSMKSIESIVDIADYNDLYELIETNYYSIKDISSDISSRLKYLDFDEDRINTIQERMFNINKIFRKYGGNYQKLMEQKEVLNTKIQHMLNINEYIVKLQEQFKDTYDDLLQIAINLNDKRCSGALALEKEVIDELKALHMEQAIFKIVVDKNNEENQYVFDVNGINDVNFLISTNVGHELAPLVKIASGGEISRIMLGLKTIFTKLNNISLVIFDEIDTGVSGKVASSIGKKMKQIAQNTQVLCITHLPQVAVNADHHLYISKKVIDQMTSSTIEYLDDNKRVEEIAKMLSGNDISNEALENAKTLLKKAKK